MEVNWDVGTIIAAASALFAGIATLVAVLVWRGRARTESKEEGKWRGRVDTLLEQIGKDLSELRQIVFARFSVPLLVSRSPLQLTKLGKTVSEEIRAVDWVGRVAPALQKQIEGKDAYEIQEFCFEHVENTDQYRDEERRAMRKTAYERGLEITDVRRVLAIELRDRLLKSAGLEPPE